MPRRPAKPRATASPPVTERLPAEARAKRPPRVPPAAPTSLTPTGASLLGFLHEGPLSGWDIVAKAEQTIGDFWNVTKSQVYRELKTLAAAGYLTQKKVGPRDRQPYAITESGRRAFSEWIARAPSGLTMRWPLALSVFFGRHLDEATLRRFGEAHRESHAQILATLRGLVPSVHASGDVHVEEVLRLGVGFHELVVAWIDGLPWMREKRARKGG